MLDKVDLIVKKIMKALDGTGEHFAKWNKPGVKRQIPYDLTYCCNLINKTSQQNITRDIEVKNKLTVTPRNGEGIMGEEGEALSRNMCKGPMDKATEG